MTTTAVTNTSTLTAILDDIDLGPTNSIQLAFAKLQLAQAQTSKTQAESYMKQIEDIQSDQKTVAEMIQRARTLQNKAKNGEGDVAGDNKACYMPDDMVAYFKEKGISFDTQGNDNKHNYDEWTYNIESLTSYQESISNKTQTLMVYLQDFISQYNSYLQGANSAISTAGQVLTSIATGR